jgi:hypothetical protein
LEHKEKETWKMPGWIRQKQFGAATWPDQTDRNDPSPRVDHSFFGYPQKVGYELSVQKVRNCIDGKSHWLALRLDYHEQARLKWKDFIQICRCKDWFVSDTDFEWSSHAETSRCPLMHAHGSGDSQVIDGASISGMMLSMNSFQSPHGSCLKSILRSFAGGVPGR